MTTASILLRRCFSAWTLACALLLLVPAPAAHARSKPDPDKYAHKIEKKLAHYKKGALLHIVFLNNTDSTGTLGELSDHSFSFVNLETNATETHNYADVDSVSKGSNDIGKSHRHHGIL